MKTQNCKKYLMAKLQMCTNYVFLAIKKKGEKEMFLQKAIWTEMEKNQHI